MTLDLIITTHKPDEHLVELVDAMATQTVAPGKIIILNKEEKYFDRLLYKGRFMENHKNVEVHHVSTKEYDRGKSRNQAFKYSDADFVLLMDQQAMPVGNEVAAKLLAAFEKEPKLAVAYARPIPSDDIGIGEKYLYDHYFSGDSAIHSASDLNVMGWKACLCSNLCAMYRRSAYDKVGGFSNHIIRCEDVVFASHALNEGFKVAYVSSAEVVFSWSKSVKEAKGDAFDTAVAMAMHPEVFDMREIKAESHRVMREAHREVLKHSRTAGFKYRKLIKARESGFGKGRIYKKLPNRIIMSLSNSPEFWRAEDIIKARGVVNSREGYGRSKEELDMLHGAPIKTHDWNIKE